ncbi:DUF397 domain-containing protein [Streptomyces sp. NPDC023723]|uniref:DUF397 domain-containing protein n=1 Tax=Streptomyces sp. NPDC023723 TaxID=3154323 RepID=UPI003402DB71
MKNLQWRKSTYSGDSSNCVETASVPTAILVRDSKKPAPAILAFPPAAWAAFLSHAMKKSH